jgi:hypothetical protein
MSATRLIELEQDIRQLSLDDQLWLMERIVQQIRRLSLKQPDAAEHLLELMAHDPEIQSELHEIEMEFAFTESNGLDQDQ